MTHIDPSDLTSIVRYGYDQLYGKHDVDALEPLLHKDFVDHNPHAPSGKADALEFLRHSPLVTATAEVQRIVAEGDVVMAHARVRFAEPPPGLENGAAVVDIWRFEDGLIAEHWDVVQPVPTDSPNPHAMF